METVNNAALPVKARREFWPTAIVLSFVFFISFILFCVWMMTKNKSELISADYYEQEIGYQQQIDKTALARQMNKNVGVEKDAATQSIVFSFPPQSGADHALSGTISFLRPSDSKLDFSVTVTQTESGKFIVPFLPMLPGLWSYRIDWKENGNSFLQEDYIRI